MYYEVFIPSPDPDGFDVTITVEADNWMSALKSGLERTGEGAQAIRNVMCDIKDDNSIHVTDATTQRVFVLRETDEAAPDEATEDGEAAVDLGDTVQTDAVPGDAAESAPEPAAPAESGRAATPVEPESSEPPEPSDGGRVATPIASESPPPKPEPEPEPVELEPEPVEPEPEPEPVEPEPEPSEEVAESGALGDEHSYTSEDGRMRVGSATHEALQEQDQEGEARVVREERSQSDVKKSATLGRRDERVSESLIEDIFLEIQEIHEGEKPMEEVVNFVMDMAMDKIDAESGSVLFADVNGTELYFATARGPKADEVMDYRVPMGKGIVGFCTREGVSLAISDAENDPRFYREISESIGYETRGLICAPVQHQGRVYGALELINKKNESGFRADDMNALTYLGRQLAKFVYNTIMRREKIGGEG